MFNFDSQGKTLPNGEVRFQLKATEKLRVIKQGTVISLSTKDLHNWSLEIYPFILVVFDATKEHAYWLHIRMADNPNA